MKETNLLVDEHVSKPVLSSEIGNCRLEDNTYFCPKSILKPIIDPCVTSHMNNDIEEIQQFCELRKTHMTNSLFKIKQDTLYYTFPKEKAITQTCNFQKQFNLVGTGIMKIPKGCVVRYGMDKFSNLARQVDNVDNKLLVNAAKRFALNMIEDSVWSTGTHFTVIMIIISVVCSVVISQLINGMTFVLHKQNKHHFKKSQALRDIHERIENIQLNYVNSEAINYIEPNAPSHIQVETMSIRNAIERSNEVALEDNNHIYEQVQKYNPFNPNADSERKQ